MAKRKNVSLAERIGQTVSDIANAASVAATGSEIGVLELATEDEISPTRLKSARKRKVAQKKKKAKKAGFKQRSKSIKKKRPTKRG